MCDDSDRRNILPVTLHFKGTKVFIFREYDLFTARAVKHSLEDLSRGEFRSELESIRDIRCSSTSHFHVPLRGILKRNIQYGEDPAQEVIALYSEHSTVVIVDDIRYLKLVGTFDVFEFGIVN